MRTRTPPTATYTTRTDHHLPKGERDQTFTFSFLFSDRDLLRPKPLNPVVVILVGDIIFGPQQIFPRLQTLGCGTVGSVRSSVILKFAAIVVSTVVFRPNLRFLPARTPILGKSPLKSPTSRQLPIARNPPHLPRATLRENIPLLTIVDTPHPFLTIPLLVLPRCLIVTLSILAVCLRLLFSSYRPSGPRPLSFLLPIPVLFSKVTSALPRSRLNDTPFKDPSLEVKSRRRLPPESDLIRNLCRPRKPVTCLPSQLAPRPRLVPDSGSRTLPTILSPPFPLLPRGRSRTSTPVSLLPSVPPKPRQLPLETPNDYTFILPELCRPRRQLLETRLS